MRPILEIYETLDQYQKGLLSDEDKCRVDELCTSDPVWKEAKMDMELANEAVLFHDLEDVRLQMGKDLAQIPLEGNKKGPWLLGGGIGILVIIGIFWFWNGNDYPKAKPIAIVQQPENTTVSQPVATKEEILVEHSSEKASAPNQPKTNSRQIAPEYVVESQHSTEKPTIEIFNQKENTTIEKPASVEKNLPTESSSTPCPIRFSDKISFSVKPSCVEKQTGQVLFQIPEKDIVIIDNHGKKATEFVNLSEGNHTFIAQWKHSCSEEIQVFISSKKCSNPPIIFNPSLGEVGAIPVENGGKYHITILNRSGLKIWENHGQGQELHWDGITTAGTLALPDMYVYTIIYEDGISVHGQISVVK